MPFGGQVLTNKGLTDISDLIGIKLLDVRLITFTADRGNSGSFTVPIGKVIDFNAAPFNIFCYAARNADIPQASIMALGTLQTYVNFPATIGTSSVATVNYRGGSDTEYRFWTYIIQLR